MSKSDIQSLLLFLILLDLLHTSICFPTRSTYIRQWILTPALAAAVAYMYTNDPRNVKTKENPQMILFRHMLGGTIVYTAYSAIYLSYIEPGFSDILRRFKDEKRTGSEESTHPSDFPFWRKIGWAFDMNHGLRKVGWNQEPTEALPPHPNCSRAAFIRSRVISILINFLASDLAITHQHGNVSFDNRIHLDSDGPETYIGRKALLLRAPDLISWAVVFVCATTVQHSILAIMTVGLGLFEPADWPTFFGSFADAYSIRRFWGRSWHQIMRFILSGIGKHVAKDGFKFKRGTNRFYYTQVYITFFLSGLMHAGGDYMLYGYLPLFSFQFFLLQAVGISFENFIIWMTGRVSSKLHARVNKMIGYVWVIVWFCWTGPMWIDPMSVAGMQNRPEGVVFRRILEFWNARS